MSDTFSFREDNIFEFIKKIRVKDLLQENFRDYEGHRYSDGCLTSPYNLKFSWEDRDFPKNMMERRGVDGHAIDFDHHLKNTHKSKTVYVYKKIKTKKEIVIF